MLEPIVIDDLASLVEDSAKSKNASVNLSAETSLESTPQKGTTTIFLCVICLCYAVHPNIPKISDPKERKSIKIIEKPVDTEVKTNSNVSKTVEKPAKLAEKAKPAEKTRSPEKTKPKSKKAGG